MPPDLIFIIAVSWCAIGFAAYYFLSHSNAFSGKVGRLCLSFDQQGNQVLVQRLLGLFFLGLLSAVIILIIPGSSTGDYGLNLEFLSGPPWWTFLAVPIILVLGFFAAKQEGNLELYPQIRAKIWTSGMLFISGTGWILFLIGYEFLFRGFLLQASLGIMDTGPAIALNCALYALAHFYKGPGETFGAIPVGILFCYLTIVTGNIWCAVGLHALMALSNEWFSLYFHPGMEMTKAR